MKVLFFGCWARVGHFLWQPDGEWPREPRGGLPWHDIDATLTPGPRDRRFGNHFVHGEDQHEGHAKLHHKDNWTALAWWGQSIDPRGGANAALFVEGIHAFDEMLAIGKTQFHSIFARFEYQIREAP